MFWKKPRSKNHSLGVKKGEKNSIQDFFNHVKLSDIYKIEADIFQQLIFFISIFDIQVSISSFKLYLELMYRH